MKVIFHYRAGPRFAERLHALRSEGTDVTVCPPEDAGTFRTMLADADVLWHVLEPVTAEHIAAAPRLRLIQKIGVGVNTIDLEAARVANVAVSNMPGTNTQAVAEMTLALMLAALRRLPVLDRLTRDGCGWAIEPALHEGFGEIHGRTVGLVGYGGVARALVPVLRALGACVLYTARSRRPDAAAEWRELDPLLEEADIVSLHLPLEPATAGLIGADRLARMRPGAVLVNTARGGLVDEAALAGALREGRLSAAALDVFGEEPVAPGNPLLALPNVVVAPHLAWLTPETLARSLDVAAENCRRLATGQPLLNRVA